MGLSRKKSTTIDYYDYTVILMLRGNHEMGKDDLIKFTETWCVPDMIGVYPYAGRGSLLFFPFRMQ
jgi:hypothetical protein